jgi:hypothetical protein
MAHDLKAPRGLVERSRPAAKGPNAPAPDGAEGQLQSFIGKLIVRSVSKKQRPRRAPDSEARP